MPDQLVIKSNRVPRDVLDGFDLSPVERERFDYVDWAGVESGTDSASFFRFKGEVYDLGEFSTTRGLPEFSPLTGWDGYINDSFFSGIVVRFVDDGERIVVGTFYA